MSTVAPAGRATLSRIGRIMAGAVVVTMAARLFFGNFVVNDWQGWSTFAGNAVAMVVESVLLGLIVFFAARSFAKRGSPAVGACLLGVLGVVSLAVPYSALQVIIGAGAISLATASRDRDDGWRTSATVGGTLGTAAIVCWAGFLVAAVITGDWPVHY